MAGGNLDALWARFAAVTRARIGLGRCGDALPTQATLDFQHAHACARDAVMARLDFEVLARLVRPMPSVQVRSAANDRSIYLRRPDLGRELAPDCAFSLPRGPFDAVFVLADGLSANAVLSHAVPTLKAAVERLPEWVLGPVILAGQARVALGDDIGARMNASMVVMLIGERPGLTAPHSLGVYLTYAPRIGRSDAERNCISNIHADGLSPETAGAKLAWLMSQARYLRLTGVALKEDAGGGILDRRSPSAPRVQKPLDSESV